MNKTTLKQYFKGTRNNAEISIADDCFESAYISYVDWKRDFGRTSLWLNEIIVESSDACDCVTYDGKEILEICISVSRCEVRIKNRNVDKIEKRLDALNDLIGSSDIVAIDKAIKKIERLLPKNVWLNFDGSGRWELRYKKNNHEYYVPVVLYN